MTQTHIFTEKKCKSFRKTELSECSARTTSKVALIKSVHTLLNGCSWNTSQGGNKFVRHFLKFLLAEVAAMWFHECTSPVSQTQSHQWHLVQAHCTTSFKLVHLSANKQQISIKLFNARHFKYMYGK